MSRSVWLGGSWQSVEAGGGGGAAYLWNGSTYVLASGEVWVGPLDPSLRGFTPADGAVWEQTPES
jgi:hypothetical protein